nr:reverse transcriptase domain-containing protein [Tanacetum cinerariifolium]
MADRTMEELLQAPTEGYGEAIVIFEILAENFEIQTKLLQLVQTNQFHGFERDNPHTHISNFKRMNSTLKYRDVPNDAIKLMLFPYSLEGAARIWGDCNKQEENLRRNLNNDMGSILGSFFQNQASTSGTLSSNIIPKPKGEMKAVTTRSGLAYEGPSIPTNSSPEKKKLSLPELTPTRMTLELADRSITRPKGVTEDVFVKVGKFHFPTDFVVVDFEVDPRVPLILGRSFLRTGRALINVYGEEITLRVNDESVTFNLNQIMRYSYTYDDNSVNQIDFIDIAWTEDSCYDPEGDILFLEKFLIDDPSQLPLMDLKQAEETKAKSSIEEPSELELKELPSHLEYPFLEETDKLPSEIEVDRAKVDVIAKLPHPTTVKGVRSFLGHAGFYRRFIQDFSKIARPMTHLLEKETPFLFSKDCIDAFETLKKKLTEAPILVVPDWNLPFELMCDASDFKIGAVLGQRKTKHFQPIHYVSKTMTEAQIHYTTMEKEMLAVVYAFEKFRPYLVLLLQEFDITIRDKKRSENLADDHLSKLENPHKDVFENKDIIENFPLETLGSVSSGSTPWFADIENFHVGNFIKKGLTS